METSHNLITILGATAGGKTQVATKLASLLNGEIISADSRQVYKGMDIGTGKDIGDYIINGKQIKYHLIDIHNAGYKYSVYEFQNDFLQSFNNINSRNKTPIMCGGTGMYIESVLKGYKLIKVPDNNALRNKLYKYSLEELTSILESYKTTHNTSDFSNQKRAIRAIEIQEYYKQNPDTDFSFPQINSLIIGIKFDRDSRRRRITERLKIRLDEGMINEAQNLLDSGVSVENLIYYGLEYKYLALYLTKKITYHEMFTQLETSIHRFAKRQMTWFRRMEKNGFKINWLDGYFTLDDKIEKIQILLKKSVS